MLNVAILRFLDRISEMIDWCSEKSPVTSAIRLILEPPYICHLIVLGVMRVHGCAGVVVPSIIV
ncbi:hypothetical protein CW696_00170 [ANME-2 cluster archaeon]|nr:MAG: hypothetical protein CW696_00170 [ANME-2 cluster archaeon]RLG23228.1 MAG: hypothetical protein DRN77_04945 [Methanosarcinales archaeon]